MVLVGVEWQRSRLHQIRKSYASLWDSAAKQCVIHLMKSVWTPSCNRGIKECTLTKLMCGTSFNLSSRSNSGWVFRYVYNLFWMSCWVKSERIKEKNSRSWHWKVYSVAQQTQPIQERRKRASILVWGGGGVYQTTPLMWHWLESEPWKTLET